MTMQLARRKFDKFLQDGHTWIFTWEVSHGFSWRRTSEDRSPFEEGLANFMRELQTHTRWDPTLDVPVAVPMIHPCVDPILWGRELRWVDGPLGSTTWIEIVGDNRSPLGDIIY